MLDSTEPTSTDANNAPQQRPKGAEKSSRQVAKVNEPAPDPTAALGGLVNQNISYPDYTDRPLTEAELDIPPDLDFLNPDWEMPVPNMVDWGETDESITGKLGSNQEPSDRNEDADSLNDPLAASPYTDVNIYALIDYFAAHALNGLLAGKLAVPNTPLDASEIARLAYDCSEAMLDERANRIRKLTK